MAYDLRALALLRIVATGMFGCVFFTDGYAGTNGVCGSAHSQIVSSVPTTLELCASGRASAVAGLGPWTWSCLGANGGTGMSCATLFSASGRTLYINSAAKQSLTTDGSTPAQGFPTFMQVTRSKKIQPGDTYVVMPGTYNECIQLVDSGAPGAYITFVAMPGAARPKVVCNNNNGVFKVNGSYVKVLGLDLEQLSQGPYGATTAGGAVSIYSPSYGAGPIISHINIENNITHGGATSGIGAAYADYITVIGNVIYNNANRSPNQGSGLGIFRLADAPGGIVDTGFHNFIEGNIIYNNINLTPVPGKTYTTDGNGIILDTDSYSNYHGLTLIYGNLVFNNGGRGIHVFGSSNVTVANNTIYHNLTDPMFDSPIGGELTTFGFPTTPILYNNNVTFINNIDISSGAQHPAVLNCGTNGTWQNNLAEGAGSYVVNMRGFLCLGIDATTNKIGLDPLFVNPTTDPATANFQLKANSPALETGSPLPFSGVDVSGLVLPPNTRPNIGAYVK
jgi:parallel beta-helix repeat protein